MADRKIILNLATSLDWYIEWKKWEFDWCFTDQDYWFWDFIESVDTIFMWRKSYELFHNDIASNFPHQKIVVFSRSLENDNVKIIQNNIQKEVTEIKNQPWKIYGCLVERV